nr:11172_t:CDS:2 [Entrophospora candida]
MDLQGIIFHLPVISVRKRKITNPINLNCRFPDGDCFKIGISLLNNQGHQELSINFILIPTKSTAEVSEYFNVDPNLNQVRLLYKTNGVNSEEYARYESNMWWEIIGYNSCVSLLYFTKYMKIHELFEVSFSWSMRDGRLFGEAIVDTVDVCDDIIDISEDDEIIDDASSELLVVYKIFHLVHVIAVLEVNNV